MLDRGPDFWNGAIFRQVRSKGLVGFHRVSVRTRAHALGCRNFFLAK